eukprot:TRINITY_DN9128_c0_g1_i1.p1 TRINITY_DN9128_c0_g1~~TRINITY_DN9128_c0_g1_i1.p1  ORF type:complete len:268 (+),score=96.37 TRINITY_DN9128_c0_g1_i1:57-806(+)
MAEVTINIAGSEAPMSYTDGDPNTLKVIKKFGPFADWAAAFKPTKEFVVDAVQVTNIDWIGKRVDGVSAVIHVRSPTSGATLKQRVQTSTRDSVPTCAVLPVLSAEPDDFVLLFQPLSLANIDLRTHGCLYGTISAAGEVQYADREELAGLGLAFTTLTPLGGAPLVCSTDGSTQKIKFFVAKEVAPAGIEKKLPLETPRGRYVLHKLRDVEHLLYGPASQKGGLSLKDANLVTALVQYKNMRDAQGLK